MSIYIYIIRDSAHDRISAHLNESISAPKNTSISDNLPVAKLYTQTELACLYIFNMPLINLYIIGYVREWQGVGVQNSHLHENNNLQNTDHCIFMNGSQMCY